MVKLDCYKFISSIVLKNFKIQHLFRIDERHLKFLWSKFLVNSVLNFGFVSFSVLIVTAPMNQLLNQQTRTCLRLSLRSNLKVLTFFSMVNLNLLDKNIFATFEVVQQDIDLVQSCPLLYD